MKLILISAILIMTNAINQSAFADNLDVDKMFSRAVVDSGNSSRIKRVFEKAKRGEKITVGVIGGSITQGAAASKPENRWANLVANWWGKTFPKTKIKLVNAGIGATDSLYGALRVQEDLLKDEPDFVVIEYSVNDISDKLHAETIEGIIRQTLNSPGKPAVMMLFTVNQNGNNAQEWHSKVGRHYDIPMISYKDAIWPEVKSKNITWQDISPDEVHPNDKGHKYCAEFITKFLDRELSETEPEKIPKPIFTDVFEHAKRFRGKNLVPLKNKGWKKNKNGFVAEKPGSKIVFEVPGKLISLLFYRIKDDMGMVEVTVDGGNPVKLDGCFYGEWDGGHTPSQVVAENLKSGKHKVCIKLLEEKGEKSKSNKFEIREIMAFGK